MAVVRHKLLQLQREVSSQGIRAVRQSREATGTTGPLFLAETYGLRAQREAAETADPLFLAEPYGQAITATSGKARSRLNARSVIPGGTIQTSHLSDFRKGAKPLKRPICYSWRNHTDQPFSRNHLPFLAVSDALPVLTQMHYMFDAACGSR